MSWKSFKIFLKGGNRKNLLPCDHCPLHILCVADQLAGKLVIIWGKLMIIQGLVIMMMMRSTWEHFCSPSQSLQLSSIFPQPRRACSPHLSHLTSKRVVIIMILWLSQSWMIIMMINGNHDDDYDDTPPLMTDSILILWLRSSATAWDGSLEMEKVCYLKYRGSY